MEILRFDRAGKPIPFAATGTNALFVDHAMQVNFWHDVYHGVEVDRHGNIYYVAKADVDAEKRPVSAYDAVRRQVNVYDADGELKTRGLLQSGLPCAASRSMTKGTCTSFTVRPSGRGISIWRCRSFRRPAANRSGPDGGTAISGRRR